ncbi:hypothetical protein L210DRAFT_3321898, partial [Boletus edulis BED1]
IAAFLQIIVRFGKGKGLFGRCKAYYGTVETQGRGSLHCHMLIWLEGNPSPQQLRDQMLDDPGFRDNIFHWLEDIIHCELPGMTTAIDSADAQRPSDDGEEHDYRLEPLPSITELDDESFAHEFRQMVYHLAIKCNWHDHNDTCFKHLKHNEPRSDNNCRMRINGSTRGITELDDDTKSILLRRLHPWINNFNDVVLFLLQSNMDIKYIGSGPAAKALVYYITDYITKSDLKIHSGIQTLQAAMKNHAEKFRNDTSSTHDYRDRNLVTKCMNSLMGRQEVSHQQVMSYLVGGGDVYTSHDFRPFRFYEFIKGLQEMEATRQDVANTENIEPGTAEEDQDIILDVSTGDATVTSDILDYRYRPVESLFEDMSVWEFFEQTVKV